MNIHSDSFADGGNIPERYAFCKIDPDQHCTFSKNLNPHLHWSDAPEDTQSFALICHDPDVPTVGDDVNQEGKSVSADLPRCDFFHWVVCNIKADVDNVAEGSVCNSVTPGGKEPGDNTLGYNGINDYTGWFADDPEMGGDYGGYDGPCPPWNDERLHHYHFTIFALDVASLDLSDSFTGNELREAVDGHILDQASWTGTYTLNPALR